MEALYHIVFATNRERDLRYLGALVHSICAHFRTPEKLRFHLLQYGLDASQLEPLQTTTRRLDVELVSYRVDEVLGHRVKDPKFGYWTYLWMTEVLPESVDRVLYLDCDMLCYGDLSPLWELPRTGKAAAVVADPESRVRDYSGKLASVAPDFGYRFASETPYFNAGFLFIDLAVWRARDLLQELDTKFQGRWSALDFPDQDALNLSLQGQVEFLSPEWNLIESLILYEKWDYDLYHQFGPPSRYFQPRIRHFAGVFKPDGYLGRDSEAREFYRHLDQTAWSGWRSPQSRAWFRPLLGRLLDVHHLYLRGVRQGVADRPVAQLLRQVVGAPYLVLLYPLILPYRLLLRLTTHFTSNSKGEPSAYRG